MINLYKEFLLRGLIKDVSKPEDLEKTLKEEKLTLYCGFDPTADSLHIGSLLPLLTLMRFKKAGHKPLALIGGATGLIGDPSGKNEERNLQDDNTVNTFKKSIKNQILKITDCETVDNIDWTKNLSIIDFLRDIGKEFTVNSMLAKDSVKKRIERDDQGISFTEFSYTLMQSMDFLHLNKSYNCRLQIGGSDQWGNMVSGADLIRRKKSNSDDVFCLTFPLLTKSDGSKFGKSEAGNVWLDPQKTSPFSFFQFLLKIEDNDIEKMMKMLSFRSVEEIDFIIKEDRNSNGKPVAQTLLAQELTEIVHSEKGLISALRITKALFESDFKSLNEKDFEDLKLDGMQFYKIEEGTNIIEALVLSGLANSKREANQFVKGNAISINGSKINNSDISLSKNDSFFEKFLIVKRGKKNITLIELNN